MADLYDGETYDATAGYEAAHWRRAAQERLKVNPQIMADYGAPVKAHERLPPVSCGKLPSGPLIYDFGKNFAGVVDLKINGKKGQTVVVKHAEILDPDGSLNTRFLRTAKAAAAYTCVDGEQTWSPILTYMGFRYISVEGIEERNIEVAALALYSDVEQIGHFACSNAKLGRLAGTFPEFAGQKFSYAFQGELPQPQGVYRRDSFNERGVYFPLCAPIMICPADMMPTPPSGLTWIW